VLSIKFDSWSQASKTLKRIYHQFGRAATDKVFGCHLRMLSSAIEPPNAAGLVISGVFHGSSPPHLEAITGSGVLVGLTLFHRIRVIRRRPRVAAN
jgi:hypothetical protein